MTILLERHRRLLAPAEHFLLLKLSYIDKKWRETVSVESRSVKSGVYCN
jgi:hypothetical protein